MKECRVGTVTWRKEGEREEHGGATIFQAYLGQTECRGGRLKQQYDLCFLSQRAGEAPLYSWF